MAPIHIKSCFVTLNRPWVLVGAAILDALSRWVDSVCVCVRVWCVEGQQEKENNYLHSVEQRGSILKVQVLKLLGPNSWLVGIVWRILKCKSMSV